MIRRLARFAWALAVFPACGGATQGAVRTTPDASVDVASPDAAEVFAAEDRPAVDDLVTPVDAPPAGPLDGVWRVVDIACNDLPGSAAARIFITAPNSSSFVVRGGRSTYTLVTSTCTQRLESAVAYPAAGRAVFTATAPFACTPARCGPGCDTTPTIPYVYDYALRGGGLVMTTVGATPDVTCTAYGQSNPIRYTYVASP
jgi:hypothetical protein